jgi:hypothetical protein
MLLVYPMYFVRFEPLCALTYAWKQDVTRILLCSNGSTTLNHQYPIPNTTSSQPEGETEEREENTLAVEKMTTSFQAAGRNLKFRKALAKLDVRNVTLYFDFPK